MGNQASKQDFYLRRAEETPNKFFFLHFIEEPKFIQITTGVRAQLYQINNYVDICIYME